MLLVQPNLPRPFGLVKKQRAELVFDSKNSNKLEAWKPSGTKLEIALGFGFRRDCR
jgi:hypothetical protein